jgi:hypothetical protein
LKQSVHGHGAFEVAGNFSKDSRLRSGQREWHARFDAIDDRIGHIECWRSERALSVMPTHGYTKLKEQQFVVRQAATRGPNVVAVRWAMQLQITIAK